MATSTCTDGFLPSVLDSRACSRWQQMEALSSRASGYMPFVSPVPSIPPTLFLVASRGCSRRIRSIRTATGEMRRRGSAGAATGCDQAASQRNRGNGSCEEHVSTGVISEGLHLLPSGVCPRVQNTGQEYVSGRRLRLHTGGSEGINTTVGGPGGHEGRRGSPVSAAAKQQHEKVRFCCYCYC